jgi:hypothetical protein
MPVGIARPVCGHLTMTMPIWASLNFNFLEFDLLFGFEKQPAGWIAPLVGALAWGHRAPCQLLGRAWVRMLAAGLGRSGRIPLLNEPGCKLSAA